MTLVKNAIGRFVVAAVAVGLGVKEPRRVGPGLDGAAIAVPVHVWVAPVPPHFPPGA